MFDETDPDLEARAPGALRIAVLLAGVVVGWCLAIAAWSFFARLAASAAGTLWRAFQ